MQFTSHDHVVSIELCNDKMTTARAVVLSQMTKAAALIAEVPPPCCTVLPSAASATMHVLPLLLPLPWAYMGCTALLWEVMLQQYHSCDLQAA